MEKKNRWKIYSTVAGCTWVLYALLGILGVNVRFIEYILRLCRISYLRFSELFYIEAPVATLILSATILALGIMFLIRKHNVITPILFGIVAGAQLLICLNSLLNFPGLFGKYQDVLYYLPHHETLLYHIWFFLADTYSLLNPWIFFVVPIVLLLLALYPCGKMSDKIRKLWWIPALLAVVGIVAYVLNMIVGPIIMPTIIYGGDYVSRHWAYFVQNLIYDILPLLSLVLFCVATAFAGKSLSLHEPDGKAQQSRLSAESGYCDMTKHILLMVFVGFIWLYVWIYRTTVFLNETSNEERRKPVAQLLLCMFVPFYYLYWIYVSARRIEILAKEKNMDCDIVTLSVVLSLFIGIIPPIIMQSKINRICRGVNNRPVVPAVEVSADKTEEIRNYKKLLEDGIITADEFDAKKKQLLGL